MRGCRFPNSFFNILAPQCVNVPAIRMQAEARSLDPELPFIPHTAASQVPRMRYIVPACYITFMIMFVDQGHHYSRI